MTETADQFYVRKVNTVIVLDALRRMQPISRASLSKKTGLNRSTISSIIQSLLDIRFVRETELVMDQVGRPPMPLTLDPNGGFAIGLEINVDYVSAILVDFSGQMRRKLYRSVNANMPQHEILMTAVRMATTLVDLGRGQDLPFLGMGIGLPGVVDSKAGKLIFAPNLDWRDLDIGRLFFNEFNAPVLVENEANCAALGEYRYGATRGVDNLIYLSAGIGLGGGILIDGEIFHGSQGFAGEIGHMQIQRDGKLCACGKRGCWETYVSPRVLIENVRKSLEQGQASSLTPLLERSEYALTFRQILEAAEMGDDLATAALTQLGHDLAAGIGNLVNIFNPSVIVIGGTLTQAGTLLIPAIQEQLSSQVLAGQRALVQLVPSQLGVDACVHGAVALVLDAVMRDPTNWLN